MTYLVLLHFLVPLLLIQPINVTADSLRTVATRNMQSPTIAFVTVVDRHSQQQRHRNRITLPLPPTPAMLGVVIPSIVMPSALLHIMKTRQVYHFHSISSNTATRGTSFSGITSLAANTNDDEDNIEQKTTKVIDPIKSYGFDDPSPPPLDSPSSTQNLADQRLRRSLDESAKFKVKNDARFAWLTTFLVSCAYTYGCIGGEDGKEILAIAGIPNGGIVGGVVGVLGGVGSIVLFFAPELFGRKRRDR